MSIRVVYSDLDGTMVGPGGSFFRTEDLALTLEPARALVELHDAGIALVLVSGRTRPQLLEAGRIFGADGFIAELGAVIGWDAGRSSQLLAGEMPAAYAGTPVEVMDSLGVVEQLLEKYAGRLEYHSPWHRGHEVDVMLRGRVDVAEAEGWLAGQGVGWLRLRDNGVLPSRRSPTLDPMTGPTHVYHLMPAGLSKGRAVAWDLARRGLAPADALAIGDSASDLDMAAHVRTLWLTANGARHGDMRELVRVRENVRVADAAVGLGWTQAVRSAVAGAAGG
ncbi:MAG: HAD family hydrolase [Mycobacteriales bacterium]